MSPLVSGEMLGLFVNTLTPDGEYPAQILELSVNTLTCDGKYAVPGCENLQLQFKCNYLKNEKLFLNVFFHF